MDGNNICKFNLNRSSDLVCSDFVYETMNTLAQERLSDKYLLGLVISGEGRLVKRDKSFDLNDGSLFFVHRDECFQIDGQNGFEYCYIKFLGRRALELIERSDLSEDCCVFQGYGEMRSFWLDCLRDADDSNVDLLAESVLLYSLAHLRPAVKKQSDLLTKMLMITDDRFTDATFTLSSLADELGYDAKYLSFLFKRKKGVTFTQYLRDLRLRHAIFLMEQGVVSVKNTAILSGFDDALYFSKIFKKYTGKTPKEYIEDLHR